jgi:hypothetical protein
MSEQTTLKDTHNVISSQESGAGQGHCSSPAGRQLDLFGREAAHANPFRWPGLEKAMKIKDTSGRSSPDLYVSANLQRSLESRLRQSLDVNGSPEYDLIWKKWDMKSGPPICALRASARRTLGRDCGLWHKGWRTASASDGVGGVKDWIKCHETDDTPKLKLRVQALTAGWPTASSRDHKDTPGMSETGTNPDGSERKRLDQLPRVSQLTIPEQSGGPAGTENGEGCPGVHLKYQTETAGYPTPNHNSTGPGNQGRQGGENLQTKAEVFMMPDMTGWRLNPLFSLWLMGYPAEWAYCVVPEMRFTRR